MKKLIIFITISLTTFTNILAQEFIEIPNNEYASWKISLNEINPNPSNDEEWIELYNADDTDHDLIGWKLDDNISTKAVFFNISESTIIKSKSYLLLKNNQSILNNSEDDVILFSPDNVQIDSFHYKNTKTNLTWNKIDNNWVLEPESPGLENTHSIISEPVSTDIEITGIALVDRDILGKNIFYIKADKQSYKVLISENDNVDAGDMVTVKGSLVNNATEPYIKINLLNTLSKEKDINIDKINISEINMLKEGNLVKVSGIISETNGAKFQIKDKTGQIDVYIKDSTSIKKPYTRVGYYGEIIGIISQSGQKDGSAYLRLLPRYQSDVQIYKDVLADTGVNTVMYSVWGFCLGIIVLFLKIMRLNRKFVV